MSNLIYQYWDGDLTPAVADGSNAMRQYAERIGAEYIFDNNPNALRNIFKMEIPIVSPYYSAFKPVWDKSFDEYDKILYADVDVWPLKHMSDNIFDDGLLGDADIGICTEPLAPELRKKTACPWINHDADLYWAKLMKQGYDIDVPKLADGSVEVFNSGVVLYSRAGRIKARERWVKPDDYYYNIIWSELDTFYTIDQCYLHAMMFYADMDIQRLDNSWNCLVHHQRYAEDPNVRHIVDERNGRERFVHIQLHGAEKLDKDMLQSIANDPREEWKPIDSLMGSDETKLGWHNTDWPNI